MEQPTNQSSPSPESLGTPPPETPVQEPPVPPETAAPQAQKPSPKNGSAGKGGRKEPKGPQEKPDSSATKRDNKKAQIDDQINMEMVEIEPRAVPRDFALRVATRITSISEREMDESLATARIGDLLYRNLKDPDMHAHFLDVISLLLANEDTQKYGATTWASLIWHEDEHPEYRGMLESLIKSMADGHILNTRPSIEHEDTGKYFSAFATSLGEVFIQMMRISSDLYDMVTDIYTLIIRLEMARDFNRKEEEDKRRKGKPNRKKDTRNFNNKKLYDDIIDYVSQRGDFRSDNLNQKNPNEFIIVLADRMRSTRRYVIQDIMNRQALEKKKQLEKELREREASAEEVIMAAKPFNHGLYLYWVEKRYNFKYLAVEKVRITLQVLGFLMGIGGVGASYLQLAPLSLMESLLAMVQMIAYSKIFCSKFFFIAFYPKDVTAVLEEEVGVFTPIFRKVSADQMTSFINRQIRHPDNSLLLHLMPEYFKYIFAVMPDRTNLLMSKDELNEVMERVELNISKYQRGGAR
ncbi:MAG: hypothetical protein RRB13_00385 [bacterium]|nr:hypothetical protein [bacterium]